MPAASRAGDQGNCPDDSQTRFHRLRAALRLITRFPLLCAALLVIGVSLCGHLLWRTPLAVLLPDAVAEEGFRFRQDAGLLTLRGVKSADIGMEIATRFDSMDPPCRGMFATDTGDTNLVSKPGAGSRGDLNMSFYSLVKDIQENFPVTADYVRSVGFTIIGWNSPDVTTYYKCEDVSLLDGVRLEKIEFRILKGTKKEGSLFIFYVQGKDIIRQDLEERVGIFSLYDTPTGRSGNERITYIKRLGNYSLRAEYDQQEPNVLRTLYFDSITSIQAGRNVFRDDSVRSFVQSKTPGVSFSDILRQIPDEYLKANQHGIF